MSAFAWGLVFGAFGVLLFFGYDWQVPIGSMLIEIGRSLMVRQ